MSAEPTRWQRLLSDFKRIVGMPDYRAYLAHMASDHHACTPMTEREYYDQFVSQRYGSGGTRCC